MNTSIHTLLRDAWGPQELTLRPPVSDVDIQEFEQKFDVRVPDDVKTLFLTANGFGSPNDQDRNGFSFWPLNRVCPVAAFEDSEWCSSACDDCYLFADYLSLSWGYAVRLLNCQKLAPVCIVGAANRRPVWIAESFREFIELYVSDDERLYSVKGTGR